MAARRKRSKTSLYVVLAVIVVVLLVLYFFIKSNSVNLKTGITPVPTTKPATSQNVITQSQVGARNGPISRNLLSVKSGPKTGEVTLSWTRYYSDDGNYSIVYRINPGKYVFSALNAGSSSSKSNTYSYVIGSLKPGTKYYFALEIPQTNSKGAYVSPEISVVAP